MLSKKSLIAALPALLTIFLNSWVYSEDLIIDIGNGSGAPGSQNNTVRLSLNNSVDTVKGIQLFICDEGNYLTIRDCVATGRASSFSCLSNECSSNASKNSQCYPYRGCANIVLYSTGEVITAGTGPFALITYDVSEAAPTGCFDMIPRGASAKRAGAPGPGRLNELSVMAERGEFCISGGSEDDTTTTSTGDMPATTSISSSADELSDESTGNIAPQSNSRIPIATVPENRQEAASGTVNSPETSPRQQARSRGGASSGGTAQRSTGTTTTVTAPGSPPSRLVISPSSSVVNSRGMVALDAQTIADGKELPGKYKWEIIPPSTIGSTIDGDGIFTAGNNTSSSPVEETVRVIDSTNRKLSSTATITVEGSREPAEGCALSITPSSAELSSGNIITFTAQSLGTGCDPGSYEWKVNSKIGSTITAQGIYTAGINESNSSALDIVIVKDTNSNLDTNALVTVLSGAGVPQTASSIQDNPYQTKLPGKAAPSTIILFFAIIIIIMVIGTVLFRKMKHNLK